MILLIDNYDSFSYNLVQMAGSIRPDIKVIRNDAMTVEEVRELKRSHYIIAGTGLRKDAGICEMVVKELAGEIPIMGVCLGHQAICEVYGGMIAHAKELMHGKQSEVKLDTESQIFAENESKNKGGKISFTGAKGRYTTDRTESDCEDGRRRSDGGGTQKVSGIWSTVPSGIYPDAGR